MFMVTLPLHQFIDYCDKSILSKCQSIFAESGFGNGNEIKSILQRISEKYLHNELIINLSMTDKLLILGKHIRVMDYK